jgi:hypothetical protein
MAVTRSDAVYSGTLTTSEVTILTVATNTTFIIKGFWISNSSVLNKYAILKIDDKRFVSNATVPAKDALIQDNLHIPVMAGKTIKVAGEIATDMDYYIWGIQEVVS